MWYNSATNQLQSDAPWGSSYLDPSFISQNYPGWTQVADSFIPPVSLAQAQATQIASIQAAVLAIENGGIPYTNAAGVKKTIPSDDVVAKRFLYAERKAQADSTFTFKITYTDGSQELLTAAEIIQIPIQCAAYMQPFINREALLISQILVAPDVASVQVITW